MESIIQFKGYYGFLSNFHRSPFEAIPYGNLPDYGKRRFLTNEHYFQSAKAYSQEVADEILMLPTPAEAKAMGREIQVREDWDCVKLDVMLSGLRWKFSRRSMAERLILTGDRRLIEGNTWGDTYWGMCLAEGVFRGSNWLGKLLEIVREECRNAVNCGLSR